MLQNGKSADSEDRTEFDSWLCRVSSSWILVNHILSELNFLMIKGLHNTHQVREKLKTKESRTYQHSVGTQVLP